MNETHDTQEDVIQGELARERNEILEYIEQLREIHQGYSLLVSTLDFLRGCINRRAKP